MSKEDSKISLSRRKALAGIGTIGAAAGLGGLGTFAQFTDTEEAQLDFTAGGIDGTLASAASYNNDPIDLTPAEETPEGVGVRYVIEDLKPGDFGSVVFGLSVENNPAWVASCIGIEENIDNAVFEPEADVDGNVTDADITDPVPSIEDYDGITPVTTRGEIPEELLFIPYYNDELVPEFFDSGGDTGGDPSNADLSDYGSGAATAEAFWSSREGEDDWDGLRPRTIRDIVENVASLGTVQWHDPTQEVVSSEAPQETTIDDGCVLLDGQLAVADESETFIDAQESTPLEPGVTLYFGYDWHLPFHAENVENINALQGDRMVLDLGFTFAQSRNSGGPELVNVYDPGVGT